MNALESIRELLKADLERLHGRINERLETSNPMLSAIVRENLRNKGKLVRPIVVILAARLLGEVNDAAIDAAAAVELLHNASLVHDDVVDNSSKRRGLPTINAVWDNHIAVLVGDFYVSTSMQLAIGSGNIRIVDALCELGKRLSLGELDQIYNARYHTLTEDAYYHVIDFKTASLFTACARMGSYALGIDDERTRALSEFARLLGLCFQVRDDIFDYFPSGKVGKPTGNDLREGKITLPLLHVLLDSSLQDHDEMLAISRKENMDDADIAALTAYAVENGGIDYAYEAMNRMRDQAVSNLDIFPASAYRDALVELFDYIITRDF